MNHMRTLGPLHPGRPAKPCGAKLHDVVHLTVLLLWWCSFVLQAELKNGSPKEPMVVSPGMYPAELKQRDGRPDPAT